MTHKQINTAIAAVYGWEADYCGDLNAMHEAETLLGKFGSDEWHTYETHLAQSNISYAGQHTHANARQRAEAFLRTLGKWEGVQS